MAAVLGWGGETERGVIAHLFFFYENSVFILNYASVSLHLCVSLHIYKFLSVTMNTASSLSQNSKL